MTQPKCERRVFTEFNPSVTRDDSATRIQGYAAVFNEIADIGGFFREKIAPGAFSGVLGNDVRALRDHDPTLILGRTKAGTLRLSEDARGLKIEIDLPDTQVARDLAVSMERGDVNQMSIAFRVAEEEWDNAADLPLRTVKRVEELLDVSVVTYPAYEQTEANLRSSDEVFASRLRPVAPDFQRRKRLALAERGELTRSDP